MQQQGYPGEMHRFLGPRASTEVPVDGQLDVAEVAGEVRVPREDVRHVATVEQRDAAQQAEVGGGRCEAQLRRAHARDPRREEARGARGAEDAARRGHAQPLPQQELQLRPELGRTGLVAPGVLVRVTVRCPSAVQPAAHSARCVAASWPGAGNGTALTRFGQEARYVAASGLEVESCGHWGGNYRTTSRDKKRAAGVQYNRLTWQERHTT